MITSGLRYRVASLPVILIYVNAFRLLDLGIHRHLAHLLRLRHYFFLDDVWLPGLGRIHLVRARLRRHGAALDVVVVQLLVNWPAHRYLIVEVVLDINATLDAAPVGVVVLRHVVRARVHVVYRQEVCSDARVRPLLLLNWIVPLVRLLILILLLRPVEELCLFLARYLNLLRKTIHMYRRGLPIFLYIHDHLLFVVNCWIIHYLGQLARWLVKNVFLLSSLDISLTKVQLQLFLRHYQGTLHLFQFTDHVIRVVHGPRYFEQLLQLFSLRIKCVIHGCFLQVVVAFQGLADVLFVS